MWSTKEAARRRGGGRARRAGEEELGTLGWWISTADLDGHEQRTRRHGAGHEEEENDGEESRVLAEDEVGLDGQQRAGVAVMVEARWRLSTALRLRRRGATRQRGGSGDGVGCWSASLESTGSSALSVVVVRRARVAMRWLGMVAEQLRQLESRRWCSLVEEARGGHGSRRVGGARRAGVAGGGVAAFSVVSSSGGVAVTTRSEWRSGWDGG